MATWSRDNPSGSSANTPRNYTDTTTTTTGPQTQTQSTSQTGGSSSTTSGSRQWAQNTSGAKKTTEQIVQSTVNKNMDDEAYAMLMNFLREQAMGGSEMDKQRRQEIWSEIAMNQAQRQGYSKEAAIIDSTAAASAQMSQALEQMLPAITAGVDAAGTSGSAMAALLSSQAAERVSRNAAQLQLEAAISYGQIANQASGIISELLKIDDKAADRFLEGLNIAKGARTSSTATTNRTQQENWSEAVRGQEKSSQTTNSTNWANTNVVTNLGPQTNTSTSSRQYDPITGSSATGTGGYSTPSSYRSGASNF